MKPLSNYPELLRILEKYSPTGQNYAQLILGIEKRSRSSDLIVPILGMQGTGKSTMINAVLSEDILPSEADETTCVPVEVRYGEDPHGEVFFTGDKPSIRVQSKTDLSQYVDNYYNPGNEKQVSHIVLHRDYPLLRTGLVIVDLPGVGSLTKANEDMTTRYIKDLCVAIFIISTSPPILKTEANFITTVWRNFNSAYFVQNVWDDNTKEEMEAGLAHNEKILADISNKINSPMLHSIIPVNAYAAAKGAFEKNPDLINSSNIHELLTVLEDFAKNYREKSAAALSARITQLIGAAAEQVSRQIEMAHMSSKDIIAAMEQEKKKFEDGTHEAEELVGAIRRQLNSDRREVRSFASATARKYAELLRTEVFMLIDKGVVDGDLLSNAFSEYQSQYAAEAMDAVYEKFSSLWENLKNKQNSLEDFMQRENINSPDAKAFNKGQAFKWEKGMSHTISIGSAIGGFLAGAAIGGPVGIVACIGISLLGSFVGGQSRKAVVKARGRETKQEIEPYIARFKSDIEQVIIESYDQFAEQTMAQLNDYVSARFKQREAIQDKIFAFRESGAKISEELEAFERDKQYLMDWSPDDD